MFFPFRSIAVIGCVALAACGGGDKVTSLDELSADQQADLRGQMTLSGFVKQQARFKDEGGKDVDSDGIGEYAASVDELGLQHSQDGFISWVQTAAEADRAERYFVAVMTPTAAGVAYAMNQDGDLMKKAVQTPVEEMSAVVDGEGSFLPGWEPVEKMSY